MVDNTCVALNGSVNSIAQAQQKGQHYGDGLATGRNTVIRGEVWTDVGGGLSEEDKMCEVIWNLDFIPHQIRNCVNPDSCEDL